MWYTLNQLPGTASSQGEVKGVNGKCLDVDGSQTADGTKVQLWTCNGSGAQAWQPQANGSVRNPQTGKCLDASGGTWNDGTPVHLWTCHTGPNQKWTLP
ncbi:hypothetical protein GCM10018773_53220 [Streptomyces candidus]|nr:hypothetical protein GCM10018773_53220 [Streptomyces candidus]